MIFMQSYKLSVIKETRIAKLWQGFHHLSENNKDLVLTITEAVWRSEQDTKAIPEHIRDIYDSVSQEGDEQ